MTAADARHGRGRERLWLGALAVTACMVSSWLLFPQPAAVDKGAEPALPHDTAIDDVRDRGANQRDRDGNTRSAAPALEQAAAETALEATSVTADELATLLPHQRALVAPHWRVLEEQLRAAGSRRAVVERVRLEQQRLASAARQVTLPTSTRP